MSWNATLIASYFLGRDWMPRDWSLTAEHAWANPVHTLPAESYRCGYCSNDVASERGLLSERMAAFVRICPQCNGPTFFAAGGKQWPGAKIGRPVQSLDPDVAAIYEEARNSLTVNSPTGAVMLCRKILMHVAVQKGAKPNKGFQEYVEYLKDNHYIPTGSEGWVDYIRKRGNEANHEIVVMTKDDGEGVLRFTEHLLRTVYELPASVPPLPPASQ